MEQALRIARDLTEALAYAHEQGVVHRDIKPANVLLSSGRAMLADFGLAIGAEARGENKITQAGVVMGTPSYMSPEQIEGFTEIDGRADLYSVGCILYEMLVGEPPFVSEMRGEIFKQHLMSAPPSIRVARPEVPANIEAAVHRVLSKSPDKRFASARLFLNALEGGDGSEVAGPGTHDLTMGARRFTPRFRFAKHIAAHPLVWALGVGVVAALVAWATIPRGWGRVGDGLDNAVVATAAPLPVVAVLPFENLTGDEALDHVGVGTARVLVTALSTLPGVTAISHSPAVPVGPDGAGVAELAHSLGATFIVQGDVQAVAERLQVTASLLRPDGSIVSGRSYEGDAGDLFDLQRRLSRGISEALQLTLRPEDIQRLSSPPTRDREAYAEYVQGRAFLDRPDVPENRDRAETLFDRAVSRDPQFALAHAGLAEARWEIYRNNLEPEWAQLALVSAEEARRLDPTHPEVRYALAMIYDGMGRHDDALEELDEVLAYQPRDDAAHRLKGSILAREGLVDEAADAINAAIDIRPGFWRNHRELGLLHYRSGDFGRARESFLRITELQPDLAWGYQMLGVAYHQEEMLDEAVTYYDKAIAIGASPASLSNLGVLHYRRGDFQLAADAFSQSLQLREDATGYRNLGDAYRKLGNREGAIEAYQQAVELTQQQLIVNPDDAAMLSILGVSLAKMGNHADALRAAARAADLEPQNADVLRRLAVVHAAAGRLDEALDVIIRAVDAGFSRSEAALDDDLAALRDDPRFRRLVQ